nr:unnamed protein product [Digitaria exilis]
MGTAGGAVRLLPVETPPPPSAAEVQSVGIQSSSADEANTDIDSMEKQANKIDLVSNALFRSYDAFELAPHLLSSEAEEDDAWDCASTMSAVPRRRTPGTTPVRLHQIRRGLRPPPESGMRWFWPRMRREQGDDVAARKGNEAMRIQICRKGREEEKDAAAQLGPMVWTPARGSVSMANTAVPLKW